jgi:hypothetical protein
MKDVSCYLSQHSFSYFALTWDTKISYNLERKKEKV